MGKLDRPGEQPDVPDEAAPAKGVPGPESGPWLNLDNESDENLRAFFGLDRDDRLPELSGKDEWLEGGQEVIVGKQGSQDDPRRVAELQDDGHLVDQPDEPDPELPSGQEMLERDDSRKSRFERGLDEATRAETVEGTHDTAKEYGRIFQGLHGDQPTGTIATVGTPDRHVVDHPPAAQVDFGLLAVLPFLPAVLAARRPTVTLGHVESEQVRGDRPDAGD